jgi:hypothetical protein
MSPASSLTSAIADPASKVTRVAECVGVGMGEGRASVAADGVEDVDVAGAAGSSGWLSLQAVQAAARSSPARA